MGCTESRRTDTLDPCRSLDRGDRMMSAGGDFSLRHEEDGNVVLMNQTANKKVWETSTSGFPTTHLILSPDGKLVLYNASTALWTTKVSQPPGRPCELFLSPKGELIIRTDNGEAVWNSRDGECEQLVHDTLVAGKSLAVDEALTSADGNCKLIHQDDGNVVLYEYRNKTWSTNTQDRWTTHFTLEASGNLVLYNEKEKVWESKTAGCGATHLHLDLDGALVLLDDHKSTRWSIASRKVSHRPNSNLLPSGQSLKPDDSLVSCNGQYCLVFRSSGDVVLYEDNVKALWSTGTAGRAATSFGIKEDGNIVLSNLDEVVWQANTRCNGSAVLELKDDGRLVLRQQDGSIKWQSSTQRT